LMRLPYSLSMINPRMTRLGSNLKPSTGTPCCRSDSRPYSYAKPWQQQQQQQQQRWVNQQWQHVSSAPTAEPPTSSRGTFPACCKLHQVRQALASI
jgi:predicted P-loop ATPase